MKEKIGGVHEQYGSLYHREWENMFVGDIVGVEGQDGVYKIKRLLPEKGIAEVTRADEDSEEAGETFRVPLKSLTKEIA